MLPALRRQALSAEGQTCESENALLRDGCAVCQAVTARALVIPYAHTARVRPSCDSALPCFQALSRAGCTRCTAGCTASKICSKFGGDLRLKSAASLEEILGCRVQGEESYHRDCFVVSSKLFPDGRLDLSALVKYMRNRAQLGCQVEATISIQVLHSNNAGFCQMTGHQEKDCSES